MYILVHIFEKSAFNMHIDTVKTQKSAERIAKLSSGSFGYTYFKNFSQKYAGYRAYFGTFLRKYVFRKFFILYYSRPSSITAMILSTADTMLS